MNEMNTIPAIVRDINTITAEFKFLQKQAQQMALAYIVQMGQRLAEAKELLKDSKAFEAWLTDEVQFKKSTAYNYIQIAEEYGADQVDLFGSTKSEAMGKLTYTQALALLAVPEEEREAFVIENHVEDMSTRELKKAIAERDAAIKAANEALEDLAIAQEELETAQENLYSAEDRLERVEKEKSDNSELQKELENAVENSKRLEKSLETAKNEAEKVQKEREAEAASAASKLSAVTKQRDVLQKELTEAKNNPAIPEELLEKIEKEAAERAKAEFEAKLKEAEADQQSAKAEAEALKKKLAQSNEDVAIFRAYLTDATETLNKLKGLLLKIKGREPETAEKLTNAVVKILSDYVGGI